MVNGDPYPEKVMRPNEPARRQSAAGPPKGQDAGAIVRAARLAVGLTLADLGRRCGYSASQVSRYERGIQPLTDIVLCAGLARCSPSRRRHSASPRLKAREPGDTPSSPKTATLASAGLG
jgi:hypothetical protein